MGEPRKQFTFYRSYYDAIQQLGKRDQAAIILAVCAYAIYETEPEGLSPAASTAFQLIRPTLDSGRKKADSGKQGGSKPKANVKQTAREKEKEKEIEIEVEVEVEGKPLASSGEVSKSMFDALWSEYPEHRRGGKANAREDFAAVIRTREDFELAMRSLAAWKLTSQWTANDGQYVPSLRNWLSQEVWRNVPQVTHQGRQLDEDDLRAIQRMLREG